MKFTINYLLLAATIGYVGSPSALAAPIATSQLTPHHIDTSLHVRGFGLPFHEVLALRMYNEILNARGIGAQTMETREYWLYPRDPKRRSSDHGLRRDQRQDIDKARVHHHTLHPHPPGPTDAELGFRFPYEPIKPAKVAPAVSFCPLNNALMIYLNLTSSLLLLHFL